MSGERKPWRWQKPLTWPKSICASPFQGICANLSTVAMSKRRQPAVDFLVHHDDRQSLRRVLAVG